MKSHRFYIYCLFILAGMFSLADGLSSQGQATSPVPANSVIVLPMKGAIGPALSGYLDKGLQKATDENAALVLIELDTPGGLLTTTREMTQSIINSEVPVAVYVTPAGAHAASAGTFILYSAHIAAMAEGTNVGAATPIQMQGQMRGQIAPSEGEDSKKTPATPKDQIKDAIKELSGQKDDLRKKAVEDTSAFIRGLAELRGRNAEWAVKAVTEASSITASEALEKNVINVLSNSREDLLNQIHGREVKMPGDKMQTLDTRDAQVVVFPPDWKTRLLTMITDPNLAMILMSIGVYGLLLEFYNPGAMVPGVIGAISLTMGLYAMNVLPINAAGAILILLGITFMLAELFIPSFGIMGFGGFAAFIGGLTILFETDSMPGLSLDSGVVFGVGALGFFVVALTVWLAYTATTKRPTTGLESMIGETASVVHWDGKQGKVNVQGENWAAESENEMDLSPGDEITVADIHKLTVKVKKG